MFIAFYKSFWSIIMLNPNRNNRNQCLLVHMSRGTIVNIWDTSVATTIPGKLATSGTPESTPIPTAAADVGARGDSEHEQHYLAFNNFMLQGNLSLLKVQYG